MLLSFEEIKELIAAVSDNKLERVEIERAGFRLQIVGRSAPTVVAAAPVADVAAAAPVAVAASEIASPDASSTASSEPEEAAAEADPAEGAHIVTSPIVGTFYSAPSPDAEPFVRIGDRVSKGQVLCIVEAMKLMNEIESDTAGVIVDIYPKNAQPVEFGEKLFAIKAD